MKNYFFLNNLINSTAFIINVNMPTVQPTYREIVPINFNVASSVSKDVKEAIIYPKKAEIIPTTGLCCKYVTIILNRFIVKFPLYTRFNYHAYKVANKLPSMQQVCDD